MIDSSPGRTMPSDALAPQLLTEGLQKRLDGSGQPLDVHHVIIELNEQFPGTVVNARQRVRKDIAEIVGDRAADALRRDANDALHPYVFAELTRAEIKALIERDGAEALSQDSKAAGVDPNVPRGSDKRVGPPAAHRSLRAIFKIWDSTVMKPLATVSIRTVKADSAHKAFSATGKDIVWAVLDSGIDQNHPHFARFSNLGIDPPLSHKDFTPAFSVDADTAASALTDPFGHGTHVAGIIAGASPPGSRPVAAVQSLDQNGLGSEYHLHAVDGICGMAPECKLMSLRILDEQGVGDVTAALNALEHVMRLNNYGEKILVHGVNISAGYLPDVRWYGIGQTPLCRMVDRLVASGVCVVVASGNTGYVETQSRQADAFVPYEAAQLASINDPGNANLAITVGSTHREKPHVYGVSYFSSKGPTADGRQKPDVVAPGEKIISCAAGASKATATSALLASTQPDPKPAQAQTAPPPATPAASAFDYLEDSGTSMAAPHVSGVIAAFLSVRADMAGEAQQIRDLVISSAMDLKRDPRMQGAGLVDLLHMLQAV
jgi:serine protease AprX